MYDDTIHIFPDRLKARVSILSMYSQVLVSSDTDPAVYGARLTAQRLQSSTPLLGVRKKNHKISLSPSNVYSSVHEIAGVDKKLSKFQSYSCICIWKVCSDVINMSIQDMFSSMDKKTCSV